MEYFNIGKLINAEYNPNYVDDKTYLDIKNSIQRFGFVDPVIVNTNENRKNIIVGGNHRVIIAGDLIQKGDVIFPGTEYEISAEKYFQKGVPGIAVNLTFEEEKELNIRLNKNAGKFDQNILKEYFDFEDLKEWGFQDFELDFPEHNEPEESGKAENNNEPDKETQKRENIAEVIHNIWAEWAYNAIQTEKIAMNKKDETRWKELAGSEYSELSEQEKDKDREQADKILEVL